MGEYMTLDRASLITLKGKPNLIGCEVGVARGFNAKNMLENLDIDRLFLIDPYLQYPVNLKDAVNGLWIHADKIEWILRESETVTDEEIPILSLDFCYIDGDHGYRAVKKDLENFWPRVKLGGLFAGHDWQETSVRKAVVEFLVDKKLQTDKDTGDWWTVK